MIRQPGIVAKHPTCRTCGEDFYKAANAVLNKPMEARHETVFIFDQLEPAF